MDVVKVNVAIDTNISELTQLSNCPRNVITLHGKLYWAYKNAIGNKLLKAAYKPERWSWFTYVLWLLTFLAFFQCFTFTWAKESYIAFLYLSALGTVCLYFPLASYCINKGLQSELEEVGAKGIKTIQPKRLQRTLLHHYWFFQISSKDIKPNERELEQCIAFIESNAKPIPSTDFFKHPLLLLALTHFALIISSQGNEWFKNSANQLTNIFVMIFVFASLVYLGWTFYTLSTDAAQDDWKFKRCLQWTLHKLQRHETINEA